VIPSLLATSDALALGSDKADIAIIKVDLSIFLGRPPFRPRALAAASLSALNNQFSFKLSQHSKNPKEQPPV
jgi:hypothetical protein